MPPKVKIAIAPPLESKESVRHLSIEEIIESAAADWDPSDPGVGRAVLLPDGREVFNPMPMAPPVGYRAEPDMMQRMQQMLRAEMLRQKEAEEGIDDINSLNDYPEDTDAPFYSQYELEMLEDFPQSPNLPEPGEVPKKEEADPPPPPPTT